MSKTIDYYNKNANDFYESTVNADMSAQYDMFEKRLYAGAHILDCGCGSGRDSKYFLSQGYEVTSIDGSEELCKKASELTGIEVKNMFFQDINFEEEFDGVWACASLLHVGLDELPYILKTISKAMKDSGILYVSFKYGDFNDERNGRFFTDLNEESLGRIIEGIPEFTLQEISISEDVRLDRTEKWLNVIVVKHEKLELKKKDELVKTEES